MNKAQSKKLHFSFLPLLLWHAADTLNIKTRQDSTLMLALIKKENI
jgi:hypothetical protein